MKIVLEQKQMLKMVMTTELRQAIELLQLSTYELLQFIEEQAEENPFIELVEKSDDPFIHERRPTKTFSEQQINPIEYASKNDKSIHDYLREQLILLHLDEEKYKLVHYLILNINEQGYLAINDEEVKHQLNVDEVQLKDAKKTLQKLEPTGIGASNLAECLTIQAKKKYPNEALLYRIIENNLQLIADKQWNRLAKKVDISLSEVKIITEKIQTLNPKPAQSFSSTQVDYVTPDIFIHANEKENSYFIQLNDYYVPNVTFNNNYSTNYSKELSQYVSTHFKKFEWLQNSIEQRRNTILKIMGVIVNRQQNFLQNGFQSLKPLTLKDVADEIGMHESTVSRATANKIVQTPVGTFELRNLFSTKSSAGGDTSQTKVKLIIKEMIEEENKYKPLSDQKIANELKEANEIVISRRTVAKYRDELQIPPSSKRKEIEICID